MCGSESDTKDSFRMFFALIAFHLTVASFVAAHVHIDARHGIQEASFRQSSCTHRFG